MQRLNNIEINNIDDSEFVVLRIPRNQLRRAVVNEHEIQLLGQADFLDFTDYQKYADSLYSQKLVDDILYYTATAHKSHDKNNSAIKDLMTERRQLCVDCFETQVLEYRVQYMSFEPREHNQAIQKFGLNYNCKHCDKQVSEIIWT